ncbi:hypothetical protein KKH27_10560, partial [bacterium]|nr:hypothetical protein [bacterium]MBU1984097.1 hypothetical protein [bacterium]
ASCFSALVATAAPLGGETATPGHLEWSYGSEVDMNSRYVWRGIVYNDRSVAQPSAWISASDLTLSVWANRGLEEKYGSAFVDEVDGTLEYARGWGDFAGDLSVSYFHYPGQEEAPATGEVAVGCEYSLGIVSVRTWHAMDYLEYTGAYWGEAGLSTGVELAPNVSLEGRTGFGWASSKFNEAYWGVTRSSFSLWSFDVALNYRIGDYFYLSPHGEFATILDRDLTEDAQRNPVNFGLRMGVDF